MNEILGSLRTEHTSSHLISVRISEGRHAHNTTDPATATAQPEGAGPLQTQQVIKKVAYLIDLQTVRIGDLSTGVTDATISHDSRVDWMEMNGRATKLLFRDRRRALHLYDIASQTRCTLPSNCHPDPESDAVHPPLLLSP